MAINKVVNKSTKSHGSMRNVIEYVLRDDKVREGFVEITGPYEADSITWDDVYKSFLAEKKLWDKDTGRMYAHNILSFHRDEKITPAEVLEIGKTFAKKFFPEHQCLIGVHQDKDHLHCHVVTNSVSYISGRKLHQTKRDLERQKKFTNDLCKAMGLSVTEKGHHFDGTPIEEGQVTAWSKDKYNLLRNETKKSFVADCAIAIIESLPLSASRDEFITNMHERGWSVQWSDTRKHIVFENEKGEKVRDSNIEKTFTIDMGKEALSREFERQNELRRAKLRAADIERLRTEQLEKYYRELESAIAERGSDDKAGGSDKKDGDATRPASGGRADGRSSSDTESFIRDIRAEISDNRTQNRAVLNADDQSKAIAGERRLAEQKRLNEQEQADRTREKRHHRSGPSL